MTLTGKVAVVTGGGRGIGEGIAEALAVAGASVAVADLDGGRAEAVAARLTAAHGSPALGVAVDVADHTSVAAAVAAVEAGLGPVEVLVNNAGIDRIGPFVESTPEDWEALWAVNLRGPIACARAVLDGMLDRGAGSIVNIASDAGRVGSTGEVVYSATKGGVIAFTKALAREVAAKGVRVNAVCPGPTDTALLGQLAEVSPRVYEGLARAIPLKRIGTPADIAPAVVFLASDAAGYITGQTLSVSGGLTMS